MYDCRSVLGIGVLFKYSLGRLLIIKCYTVPYTRKNVTVFFRAVVSHLQKLGNGLFLHPTKPAHELASWAKLSNSLGFLRAKVLRRCTGEEVLHERPSAGWVKNLAPWCNPLETGNEKDCSGGGRREEERGRPKTAAWLTANCLKYGWIWKTPLVFN